MSVAPNADRFEPLPADRAERWKGFPHELGVPTFPGFIGLTLEEVRMDYARMRLPYRPELDQPAGMIHGGALAALMDTVVVPAIASAYEERRIMLTLDMHIDYLAAVSREDAIAEGWVVKRGRSIVFCRAELRSASGDLASTASLVYKVSSRPLEARAK